MMASDYIIDVTEADFQYQVIEYSQQVPVVVDFWAEWCAPCRTLGPLLEGLAQEARGDFRLAKVNVDQNPNLAIRYAVRSIPAVKAFRNGEMIAEFLGVQPEARIREFIRSIAPNESDLLLEKGNSLLELRQASDAEKAFRQVLDKNTDSPAALLGLAKSLLLQGRNHESQAILSNFPTSREYTHAKTLLPLANAYNYSNANQFAEDDDPLTPAFYNSIRLVKRGNIEAALDGLLDILRVDKNYRKGEVRKVVVAILELLGNKDPITAQYRNELASILF